MAQTTIKNRVDFPTLKRLSEPEWTETFHPIPHHTVVEIVREELKERDLKSTVQDFCISEDGGNFFGMFAISSGSMDAGQGGVLQKAVYIRNSTTKCYALGLNIGTLGAICRNLALVGDFLEFRRHTSGMSYDEASGMIYRGMEAAVPLLNHAQRYIESMNLVRLTDEQVKALAYDAIHEGVVSKSRLPQFHEILFGNEPQYSYIDRHSLFGFHAACIELTKELNMVGDFYLKQNRLNSFISTRFDEQLAPAPNVRLTEVIE